MAHIQRKNLKFVGIDFWSRPVFWHEARRIYFCDIDHLGDDDSAEAMQELLKTTNGLYIKCPSNDFEGEPDYFVEVRDTIHEPEKQEVCFKQQQNS